MRRRRESGTATDASNDSFLDILANLVGILIILVVVVALRVKQTIQVDREKQPETPVVATVEPAPKRPEPIVLGPEDLPINVSFAAPVADRQPEPTVSADLEAQLVSLRASAGKAAAKPVVQTDADRLETLTSRADELKLALKQSADFIESIRSTLNDQRARHEQVQRDIGRVVAQLEEDDTPETEVVSLAHDVRAIATLAGPDQLYVELAESHLTLLPIADLVPEMIQRVKRKYNNARNESLYRGTVGPQDGISLSYEVSRRGESAMADIFNQSSSPLGRLEFTVNIDSTATSEPIDAALQTSSSFRFALSRTLPGTSVTAFVYPDSFAAARELQTFLQLRGIRLALVPLAEGTPIKSSPGGARVMAQ